MRSSSRLATSFELREDPCLQPGLQLRALVALPGRSGRRTASARSRAQRPGLAAQRLLDVGLAERACRSAAGTCSRRAASRSGAGSSRQQHQAVEAVVLEPAGPDPGEGVLEGSRADRRRRPGLARVGRSPKSCTGRGARRGRGSGAAPRSAPSGPCSPGSAARPRAAPAGRGGSA